MQQTAIQIPENETAARTWSAGGKAYDEISRGIADAIAHAIDRLAPKPGERVLDVATGTGWAARIVAAHGARVTGVDFGPDVIAAARRLDPCSDYQVADAEALPFPDGSFDAVLSTFGVMFAPHPESAAAELARVCKPGGRVVLANWATSGGVFRMFDLIRSYKPKPKVAPPSPFEWGRTERVVELLGSAFDLGFEEAISFFRVPDGQTAWDTFSAGFGPVVTLLETLDGERASALQRDFIALHEQYRTGAGILLPREYVITVGRRRS